MDFKIKINEAIDELEKLTGKGSADAVRKSIEGESDQSKLFLKYQALRETLNNLLPEKGDVSFTVQMPDGSSVKYADLEAFFSDEKFKKDLTSYLKSKGHDKHVKE